MKVFKELYLQAPDATALQGFLHALQNHTSSEWQRSQEDELWLQQHGDHSLVFLHKGRLLFLGKAPDSAAVSQYTWYVSNVRPVESGRITIDEYNHTVDLFQTFVQPVAEQYQVTFTTTADTRTLQTENPEAAELLHRFSHSANKSTVKSHPMDARRWYEFIQAFFTGSPDLDPALVHEALQEQGWYEEGLRELMDAFHEDMELLNFLKEQQVLSL